MKISQKQFLKQFEHMKLKPTTKRVVNAFANMSNMDEIRPSREYIFEKAGISSRNSYYKSLNFLKENDFLEVKHRQGRTSFYQIKINENAINILGDGCLKRASKKEKSSTLLDTGNANNEKTGQVIIHTGGGNNSYTSGVIIHTGGGNNSYHDISINKIITKKYLSIYLKNRKKIVIKFAKNRKDKLVEKLETLEKQNKFLEEKIETLEKQNKSFSQSNNLICNSIDNCQAIEPSQQIKTSNINPFDVALMKIGVIDYKEPLIDFSNSDGFRLDDKNKRLLKMHLSDDQMLAKQNYYAAYFLQNEKFKDKTNEQLNLIANGYINKDIADNKLKTNEVKHHSVSSALQDLMQKRNAQKMHMQNQAQTINNNNARI